MITTSYDPEAHAFHARFAPDAVPITTTEEVAPGVTIDFDAKGDVTAVEVVHVRTRVQASLAPRKPAAAE